MARAFAFLALFIALAVVSAAVALLTGHQSLLFASGVNSAFAFAVGHDIVSGRVPS